MKDQKIQGAGYRKTNKRTIFLFYILFPVSCFLLTSCASLGTYNPATGQKEFIFISTQEELALGDQVHRQIIQQYAPSFDAALNQRVQNVGQRLAQVSDRQDYPYQFFVIDDKELNAFTIPGGRIYVFRGLLERITRDDQLAAVLAHEIGHTAAKHTVKKFQAAMGYDLISQIVFGAIGEGQASQIASLSSGAIMQIVFSAYGRKDEYQADSLAIKYMNLTGFDLNGIIEVFEILKAASEGGEPPEILSTHPHLDDRIIAVKQQIETIENPAQ